MEARNFPTVLFRLVLNVTLAIVPAGDNDGQAMFFTDLATGAADLMIHFEFKSVVVKKMYDPNQGVEYCEK